MSASRAVLKAAFAVARREIDAAGYGMLVSDAMIEKFVTPIANAVLDAQAAAPVADPNQPLAPRG
jgi:hypothetical protein